MRKVALIAVVAVSTALLASCSSSSPASGGYFGVSNQKANAKKQKEFKKPKHNSIQRSSGKRKH
jgi:hypothetical protein